MRKQRYEQEMQFEEAKLQQQQHYEKKMDENRKWLQQKVNTTLPKLTITRFQGTHTDWPRFWNQFETDIVTKLISPTEPSFPISKNC